MCVATDLHGHTYYSDGTQSPEDFVLTRLAGGVRVLAVTDHDLLAAVAPVSAAAAAHGALVIPALEATAFVGLGSEAAEQFHILGYYPPRRLQDGSLQRSFFYQRGLRVQATWRQFTLDWLAGLVPADREALVGAEQGLPLDVVQVRLEHVEPVQRDLLVQEHRGVGDAGALRTLLHFCEGLA